MTTVEFIFYCQVYLTAVAALFVWVLDPGARI